MLRIDPANQILGIRLNVWTSLLLFTAALLFLLRRRDGQPTVPTMNVDASPTESSPTESSPTESSPTEKGNASTALAEPPAAPVGQRPTDQPDRSP